MNKSIIVVILGLILFTSILTIFILNKDKTKYKVVNLKTGEKWNSIEEYRNRNNIYQGPVRPTDDEEYFRQTGITKPLGINK